MEELAQMLTAVLVTISVTVLGILFGSALFCYHYTEVVERIHISRNPLFHLIVFGSIGCGLLAGWWVWP